MNQTKENFDVVWYSKISRTLKNLKKNTAKMTVAIVMAAIIAVPSVNALTLSDVELLISLGIIPAEKATTARAAVSGNSSTVSCGSFTRDLTLGSTGADVISLQTFLESKGMITMLAGVSKGYFGQLTKQGLAKYQASVGIAPAVGYFGPLTRSNVALACAPGNPTPNNPNTNSGLSGDEASLESFNLSSGDDSDVKEDASGDIAEIEFDVEDGDIMLDRIDLAFVNSDNSDSTDPWNVFEEVELVLDGKVIGSADLSDEDDYLDEDDGTIRISGIKTKIDEGDTAKIIIRVTTQNNVDSDDLDTFEVYVLDNGIRATDAKGIQQYIGSDSDTVSFDVVEAGDGEELKVSSSKSDPDSTTLKVEDNKKSSLHEIFVFDVEAEESDIEIDRVKIFIETSAITANIISDLVLEIDGEEFDDWSYVSGGNGTSTRVVEFDIDRDFTIEADNEVEFVLLAEFKAANGSNYSSGETIRASIVDDYITGEGADDVVSDGTATGETHTLATQGIVVPVKGVKTSTNTQGSNDTVGIFKIEFEVTAFEEDFFIVDLATTTADGSTGGVEFTDLGDGVISATLSSTANENGGVFEISEGETETFTLTVTFDPTNAGQYRLTLDEIWASTNSNGITGSVVKTLNATDFRTAYENIN